MSESDQVETKATLANCSTALLAYYIHQVSSRILTMEQARRPFTTQTAKSYDRALEMLIDLVDELARRA